ncbi:MAG: 3'-5' exonuclease [Holophagales bacterium]|nr:3'-5' exonuclease [Holophagales bacterium]
MLHRLRRLLRRCPWTEVEHWALDLETTGLDPRRDEILSAGLVPIRGGIIHWGDRRYRLIRPEGDGASEAIAVHGLLPSELAGARPRAELVAELAEVLEGRILVVHWGRLDVEILRRVFREVGVAWPRPEVLDTVRLLERLDRRRSLVEPFARATPTRLGEARRTLGLPPHREHHALYDALATAELYLLLRARLG